MDTTQDYCGWCEGPLVPGPEGMVCLGGCPYQPGELPPTRRTQAASLNGALRSGTDAGGP